MLFRQIKSFRLEKSVPVPPLRILQIQQLMAKSIKIIFKFWLQQFPCRYFQKFLIFHNPRWRIPSVKFDPRSQDIKPKTQPETQDAKNPSSLGYQTNNKQTRKRSKRFFYFIFRVKSWREVLLLPIHIIIINLIRFSFFLTSQIPVFWALKTTALLVSTLDSKFIGLESLETPPAY
jgi:hypothetical protein